jgi:hypothetical protein
MTAGMLVGMKRQRTRANLILAASAWTLYVWVTRMWNIAQDPTHSLGFKVVHAALAVVSVAFAVVLAVIGLRMRREARAVAARRPEDASSTV